MGIRDSFARSQLSKLATSIKQAPRPLILNWNLWFSALLYAASAFPVTWEQNSSANSPSLRSWQHQFGVTSGSDASQLNTYISIIYIGLAPGGLLSFFVNDHLGRIWSYRLYMAITIIGELVQCFAPSMHVLIGSRILAGVGIGALSVSGPMAIAEIAPREIRGLLTSFYTTTQGVGLTLAGFTILGLYKRGPESRLQYQVPQIALILFLVMCILGSFFISESPRWLMLKGRREEAVECLIKLRCLPAEHDRIFSEINDIELSIVASRGGSGDNDSLWALLTEMFTKKSNLRRLQQVLLSYALAQLSGSNSITSYFIPIMSMIDDTGGTEKHIFLSSIYAFSKLWFNLIASLLFIDLVGRRRSLFIGISLQMITLLYIGVFLKYNQEGSVAPGAAPAALGAIFIHSFGFCIGLFIMPYVFGSELWPNRIRSLGGAVTQFFHWIFIYAIKYSIPSIMDSMNNWGAFIFFAAWCAVGLTYSYLMVPEVAGLSVEEMEHIFDGPWYNAFIRSQRRSTLEGCEPHIESGEAGAVTIIVSKDRPGNAD